MSARLIDRVGKGIRGAPRDALIADIAPPEIRGAAFGLRQSLDSVGAFLGPLSAIGLMLLWANDFRAVFWVAVIPGVLAVVLLFLGVQEPERKSGARRVNPIQRDNFRRLTRPYWIAVGIGAVFTLARFSEAFLVLRDNEGGLPIAYSPLVLVGMNAVFALAAYPFGKLADTMSHTTLLAVGLAVLIAGDAALAYSNHWTWVWAGISLWGLHMAFTQGLLSKLVADTVPAELRGSGFGVFNLVSGIALLLASVIAGALWSVLGPSATFYPGASFAAIAAIGIMAGSSRVPSPNK